MESYIYALIGGTAAFIALLLLLSVFVLNAVPQQQFTTTTQGTTSSSTIPGATTVSQQGHGANYTQLEYYVLSLINRDRQQYGLNNVTLSAEPSAPQHSQSMLQYQYFSHWDPYGMKPYMRYTLMGGTGSVSENVATNYSTICIATICHGNINVTRALAAMEYNMMNNDQQCCNNGHRDNILGPAHNQVSIGIAYDAGRVYLTQDFIDSYIAWNDSPQYGSGEVILQGQLLNGAKLQQIEVSYDPPVQNMTVAQLNSTRDYGYGQSVAGVVRSSVYYYSNLTTIVADRYQTGGSQFSVDFNIDRLINQYGAGEYTVLIWLNSTQGNFIGSTYTIFINSDGAAYAPSNV